MSSDSEVPASPSSAKQQEGDAPDWPTVTFYQAVCPRCADGDRQGAGKIIPRERKWVAENDVSRHKCEAAYVREFEAESMAGTPRGGTPPVETTEGDDGE